MKTAKQSMLSSGVPLSAGASYSSVLQEVGVVYTNPVCTKEMSLVAPLQSLTHLPFLSSFSPFVFHCSIVPPLPSPPSFLLLSPSLPLSFSHSSPFLPFCSFTLPLPLPCADQGEGSEQREKWVPAR